LGVLAGLPLQDLLTSLLVKIREGGLSLVLLVITIAREVLEEPFDAPYDHHHDDEGDCERFHNERVEWGAEC
jgi:hypothetical protein